MSLTAEGSNRKVLFFPTSVGSWGSGSREGAMRWPWLPMATRGHCRAESGRQSAGRTDVRGLLRKENSIVRPLFGSLGPFQASLRPEPTTSPLRGAGEPLDRRNLREARTLLSLCILDTAFQLGTRRLGLCKGRDWGQEKGTTEDEMAGWHH